VAGDDPVAVDTVAGVIDRIGYDPVQLPGLHAGRLLEPGGPVFGVALQRNAFQLAVSATAREE
jgi:predicted dinucleotide-binding enzyme